MDKKQTLMETVGAEMTAAIKELAKAIRYLADVIGFKGDADNPKDSAGQAAVTLEAEAGLGTQPQETPPTLQELKDALNRYAKQHGKEAAFAAIQEHGGSAVIGEIPEERYSAIMQAIT